MSYEFIAVETRGPITIITINRPKSHNAMHLQAHIEAAQAMDVFAADPAQWVAIITGAGEKAFCAGADLVSISEGPGIEKMGRVEGARAPDSGFAGLTTRYDLAKPVIAAVNGVAFGGGFETALACDLIIAAENASFSLPEPRVGLAALAGGVHRLPRQIPLKHAMGILLTGRRVGAQEGFDLGFVNEVVPVGKALEGALRWAELIIECSPAAVRATKEATLLGLEQALANAQEQQFNYPAMQAMFASPDSREGPTAFVEKRKPNWQSA